MVQGNDYYSSGIICPVMPVLIGQPLAPPVLWPLNAAPPNANTIAFDEAGMQFYPPSQCLPNETAATTSVMATKEAISSGALLAATALTSESMEPWWEWYQLDGPALSCCLTVVGVANNLQPNHGCLSWPCRQEPFILFIYSTLSTRGPHQQLSMPALQSGR
jgi:hypothetical protein